MDDMHEELTKEAAAQYDAMHKKLDEIFAEHFKIGTDISAPVHDESDYDPGAMIAELLGMNDDR